METNEIMNNEETTEVMETAMGEVASNGSGFLKSGVIGGLVVLASGLAVQYAIKPGIAWVQKKRAKKNKDAVIDADYTEVDEDDSEDMDEDDE